MDNVILLDYRLFTVCGVILDYSHANPYNITSILFDISRLTVGSNERTISVLIYKFKDI